MRIGRLDAWRTEVGEVLSVVEHIHCIFGLGQMPSLYHHVSRAHTPDDNSRLAHISQRVNFYACQCLGFMVIRSDDVSQRHQFRDQDVTSVLPKQRITTLGDHHRVYYQPFHLITPRPVRHHANDLGVGQHACLPGIGSYIAHHRVDLLAHEVGWQLKHALHAYRVLGSDGSQRAHTVHAAGSKGFQISLNASPTPRI